MNKYQEEIKLKVGLGKGKDYVARYLASIGQDLNEKINERTDDLRRQFPKADLFYLAIAESFVWNDYALDKKEFFKRAVMYYQDDDTSALDKIEKLAGIHGGRDGLKKALINWKRILNQTPVSSFNKQPEIKELVSAQLSIKTTVQSIKIQGKTSIAFGSWLLTAPFQIVVCHYKKLWEDNKLDNVLIPLGGQVKKGLLFLIKNNVLNIEAKLVRGAAYEDISTSMGRLEDIQEKQKELAKLAKSRVLHINSGLYRLGGGKE